MIGRRELVADSASEPLTAETFKTHARIDGSGDDAYVADLIAAVRTLFERETGLALINQTWKVWFDHPAQIDRLGWWDGVRDGSVDFGNVDHLKLSPSPVSSITSVKSYSLDNTETVFDSANYFLDGASKPARIVLNSGKTWPTSIRAKNSLVVELVAGYGAAEDNVPADIRHALLMAGLHWYEHRGDCLDIKAESAALKIIRPLVDKYRVRTL